MRCAGLERNPGKLIPLSEGESGERVQASLLSSVAFGCAIVTSEACIGILGIADANGAIDGMKVNGGVSGIADVCGKAIGNADTSRGTSEGGDCSTNLSGSMSALAGILSGRIALTW